MMSDGFTYDPQDCTNVFLQWKGTDACFDFRCDCGAVAHFDGYFAYYVKCGGCGQIYQMPFKLYPKKVEDANGAEPIDLISEVEE